MKYDLDELEKAGVSAKKMQPLFEADDTKKSQKIKDLIALHQSRLNEGITLNLDEARIFHALDKAYDVSQSQVSPTLMRSFMEANPNPSSEQVNNLAKEWGLDKMLVPLRDGEGRRLNAGGNAVYDAKNSLDRPGWTVNVPIFTQILVPLVASYLDIRWARLYSDVDINPLYRYEAERRTPADETLCKVITARVSRQSVDMGNREDERQSIFAMLSYGRCINFPKESWHREEQKVKGKSKVIREGIRWTRPHPTRYGWDRSEPLHTLNTDTGVKFLFYWNLQRYGDLRNNEAFWNRDKITNSSPGWRTSSAWVAFGHYYPCKMQFPNFNPSGTNDREDKAFTYTATEEDKAVDVRVIFDKVVPKDVGIGSYEHPVWIRFVYAGDSACIFAEPMAYTPGVAYLYDAPEDKHMATSLSLKLLPFQDHMGNLLSQYVLSVKKNLFRLIGVNQDVMTKEEWNKLADHGETALRGFASYFYSGDRMARVGKGAQEVLQQMNNFQPLNTGEVINAIQSLINILERVLGFSPQEMGSTSTHETSATGDAIMARNTSVRIDFTSSAVRQGIRARKTCIYDGLIAYGEDDFFAEVADVTDKGKEALAKAGLKIEEFGEGRFGVSGKKDVLDIESFSSERDGADRTDNPKVAELMLAFVNQVMPVMGERLGPKVIIGWFNQIAEQMGLNNTFRIPDELNGAPMTMEGIQKVVEEMVTGFAKDLKEKALDPTAQKLGQLEQVLQQIGQKFQQTDQQMAQLAQGQQAMQQGSQQALAVAGQETQALKQAVGAQQQAIAEQGQAVQQQGQAIAVLSQSVEQIAGAAEPAMQGA